VKQFGDAAESRRDRISKNISLASPSTGRAASGGAGVQNGEAVRRRSRVPTRPDLEEHQLGRIAAKINFVVAEIR